MIDTLGIQYRLGFKQFEAEERVQTEFETNQWESREAVKFAGAQQTLLSVTSAWLCMLPSVVIPETRPCTSCASTYMFLRHTY